MDKQTKINAETILANLPGHVYWYDKNSVFLGCNERQAQSAGLKSRSEVVGKSLYDFLKPEHAAFITNINHSIIKSGTPQTIEEPYTDKNGNESVCISSKAPLRNEQDEIIGLLGVSIDITDIKQKEAQLLKEKKQTEITLQSFISSLPGYVYWKDLEGVYLGCNERHARALGLKSPKEIIGRKDADLFSETQAQVFRQNDTMIMSSGKAIEIDEEGSEQDRIYLSQKAPLIDEDSNIVGVLGISFDITERKRAEETLKKAKEQAELANNLKTNFIQDMEHDIRTPFTGILGLTNILLETENNDDRKKFLKDIASCTTELMCYCNNILDFSKIKSGVLPVVTKSFNLCELLDSIITMENPAAKIKNIRLSLDYDNNIPEVLMSDPFRVKRLLLNLVSNAIKFTPNGYVKLSVKLSEIEDTKRNLVLKFTVKDSGIGIPEDKKELIYERFTKVAPKNTGLYKGQGLGLTIVKQFVDDLGGDIHLQTEIDYGSTFSVYLPLKKPLSDEIID